MMQQPQPVTEILRRDSMTIFRSALAAVDPEEAVRLHLRVEDDRIVLPDAHLDIGDVERILVVGAGKAVAPMAMALEDLLAERISDGLLVVKDGHGLPLERIRIQEAGHPLPDDRGVRGTLQILELLAAAGACDLAVCLISGGGSALLTAPAEGISLEDKQRTTQALLACGATIHEINTIRKHLSRAKGGHLAQAAHPAAVLSLILSDVVGDDLDVIASGPTVPDRSTFAQAQDILKRYGIWDRVPAAVAGRISEGVAGRLQETPKPGDPVFARCRHGLVGSNLRALEAAAQAAGALGYQPLILSSTVEGEAREVAKAIVAIAKEIRGSGHPLAPPACVLLGGETTVTLRGGGAGGRNQELVLAGALAMEGLSGAVILAGGSDGSDGPTDAAGAIADGLTVARARSRGMDPWDYLQRNDSYRFFKGLDDLIVTGPTRTNVMDIYMVLIGA
jgi:hydroxypyruvate reductase